MIGLLAFLRELFAAPRDAAPPAKPKSPVVRTPGAVPASARVTAPRSVGIVFRQHRPGYKEEEGRAMWLWNQGARRDEAETTLDPEVGCRDKAELMLLMEAIVAPEWDAWPLARFTPDQAFAALRSGVA